MKPSSPSVPCVPRTDGVPGWQFLCPYCKVWHYHGTGLGGRAAHCAKETPFTQLGYVLVAASPAEAKGRQIRKPIDSVTQKIEEQNEGEAAEQVGKMFGVNRQYIHEAKGRQTATPDFTLTHEATEPLSQDGGTGFGFPSPPSPASSNKKEARNP